MLKYYDKHDHGLSNYRPSEEVEVLLLVFFVLFAYYLVFFSFTFLCFVALVSYICSGTSRTKSVNIIERL